LYEGKAGDFNAEGIRDLQPFFDAAMEAGIYLLAVGLRYDGIGDELTVLSDPVHTSMLNRLVVDIPDGCSESLVY